MAARDKSPGASATTRTPIQIAAGGVGVVFLLVGILGFIPGITSDFDTINFIGHESEAKLLGIFQVNIVHNIVHLLFGPVGVVAAARPTWARSYLIFGGVLYLVLWIYGLVIDLDSAANFISLNTADHWLHVGLGVAMIALGLALADRREVTK